MLRATLQGMAVEDLKSEGQNVAAADRALRGTLPGVLVKHTGDTHAVEDVLHDVMPKLLASEKADRTESDNLGGWLYTVGRNFAKPHALLQISRRDSDHCNLHAKLCAELQIRCAAIS